MTDQADIDIEGRTAAYIIDTILDTAMDTEMTQDCKERVLINNLEELLKRSTIYEIMRNRIEETAGWCLDGEVIQNPELLETAVETDQVTRCNERYSPSSDTVRNELQCLVEDARETLRAVAKLEEQTAPAMNPWV